MDVDNDPIDQNLLLQFTCLGTTDRDDLVKQFKELIDNRIDDTTASFFLEMNNWNLQNAICSFFDYETPRKLPSMKLEEGKLLSSNFIMPPNTRCTMSWTVRNNGDECWPHGCSIQFVGGDHPCSIKAIPVRVLPPGLSTTIVLDFVGPAEPGVYQSKWRMTTPFGAFFGDVLWIVFQVSAKLDDSEEISLSEELASRMALIDSSENTVQGGFNFRTNNLNSNQFYGPVPEFTPGSEQRAMEREDEEFS